MTPTQRSYAELHLAVFLFGFTAILGDLISLPALSLVWWRVFLTTISFLFLISLRKLIQTAHLRLLMKFLGIGVLVGLHWICFFGAIKIANPSIALVCYATSSFFTSLLEPFVTKKRIKAYEIALGLIIVPGMILIVNGVELQMKWGIVLGLLAAFLSALFSTLNKVLVGKLDEESVSFLEMGGAWIFLTLVLPCYSFFSTESEVLAFWPQNWDWFYLILLALLCTTFAYVLALRALRHLTAFVANLSLNLEPIYGVVLAYFFLDDRQELHPDFYWGALVIVLSIFSYPILRRRFST